MKTTLSRSLIALFVAVACAKATDEDLVRSGGDGKGGSSGTSSLGGTSGFAGTSTTGGASGKGGATTGGTTGTGGALTGGATGKGGTGGTGGTSGTDAGGASDGGTGGDDACTPPNSVPALRVDYKANANAVTEDPAGEFHLMNATTQTIPLNELTFRYWFHSEFTCPETIANQNAVHVVYQQLDHPYAVMDAGDVTHRIVALDTGAPGCDAYFEIGFASDAGDLAAGQLAIVKYYMLIEIYETARPKNQANDYSYGACTTDFVYWNKISVYRNGRLVGGTPPGGGGGGEGGEGGVPNGGMGGI